MAKQTINQGTAPTGAGGDTFRTGSAKLQANDDELYNYLGDGVNLNKLGTAAFKNVGTQAGNVMEVGAFGVGNIKPNPSLNVIETGFSCEGANLAIGLYKNSKERAVLILPTNDNYDPLWRSASRTDGSTYSIYYKFHTTRNTTTDSNGFIKAASPVIQLFCNKIELNNEAKQQEITFEKLSAGDYLIKGSSGFAQEGWYVETPKDANGNVLFSVIYTTLENGDISVKTYKKKFDLETASIVADLDNPVDITEGRWIDIRLQELPQPEIEVTESITPPDFQPTGLAQAVATVMESYHGPEQ